MEAAYCQSCMREVPPGTERCPHCGESVLAHNRPNQLPAGTLLQNRYRIGRVLGSGGFGVTYLAADTVLKSRVAIKEYFPAELAARDEDSSVVTQNGDRDSEELFEQGKQRFLREAQILESLGQVDSIVRIKNIFPDNDTVYLVMEYLDGQSFKAFLEENGPIPFRRALALMEPIMDGLEKLHAAGLIHRDISPSNLMLLRDGSTKLLDLGGAREFTKGDKSVSLLAKPGYTPLEQYMSRSAQGTWTDVYAFCATLYKLITGTTPQNALLRGEDDRLPPPSACGAIITPAEEAVLMKGLAVRAEERIQTIPALRAAFLAPEAGTEEDADERTSYGADPGTAELIRLAREREQNRSTQPAAPAPEPEAAPDGRPKKPAPRTPEPEDVPAPAPEPEKADKRRGRAPKEERKRPSPVKNRKWLIAAIAAVLLLGAGAVLLLSGVIDADKSSYASFSDTTVTAKEIKAVNRNRSLTSVYFYHCRISDEALSTLAVNERVSSIALREDCTGFSDLSPLAAMPALSILSISGEEENKAEVGTYFTADFPTVKELNFIHARSSDSSFLRHFPGLSTLSMTDFEGVDSFEALRGSAALRYVTVNESDLSGADLSALSSCSNLYYLTLSGCGLTDVSWLEPLAELGWLDLSNNAVSDISALAPLGKLHEVDLRNNQIADLSPLRDHARITGLNCSGNRIRDISPLEACTEIQVLSLADNEITDISACEGMYRLTRLNLSGNRIGDIGPLHNTTQLKLVRLGRNEIADLSPLQGNLGVLAHLYVGENRIESLSPLRGASALQTLSVYSNRLSSLDGLQDSTDLQLLYAHTNQLEDISAISGCTKLKYIDISENRIRDLSPITNAVLGSQELLAQHNQISDLSCLNELGRFDDLYLYDNPLADLSQFQRLEAVQSSDKLVLSWREDLDFAALFASPYTKIELVDVPLNQKVPLENLYNDTSKASYLQLSFSTMEEVDARIADKRVQLGESGPEN